MFRHTQGTQTGLDSISEDLNEPKFSDMSSRDNTINFRDFFGKKQLKKLNSSVSGKLTECTDQENVVYLQQNLSLKDSKDKQAELETEMKMRSDAQRKDHKKFDVFNNNVYAKRNPAIKSLIKDLDNNNSGLNQLQEDLKREFDMFLTASFKHTSESIKNMSLSSETNKSPGNGIFLTEENGDDSEGEIENCDVAFSELTDKLDFSSKINVADNCVQVVEPNSMQLVKVVEPSDKSKDWQVALTDKEKNDHVIKLNKIMESIKRVDLPKFQSELHQVCQYGSDAGLLQLYSAELDVSLNKETNGLGRFCIHECCVKGNVTMLKGMLPYIDDINKVDKNLQTAAHVAAKFNELACLKILYANGINLDLADKFGLQVAHIAAQQDHTDILEFLFDVGISLNTGCRFGKIPIHYAAEYGAYNSLKLLSKYYVDISMVDNDQNTVGHLAAKNDHLKCIQYLIELGFPVDLVRNSNGRNVTHVCCVFGSVRTLHWLFENGTNIKILDDNGNNLAASACVNGQAECFNCCVQHDVPVNSLNYADETPLDIARKCGKSLLIEKAAKNQVRCSYCHEHALKVKMEKESNSQLAGPSTLTFDSVDTKRKHKRQIRMSNAHEQRDFIAQYFGPEI